MTTVSLLQVETESFNSWLSRPEDKTLIEGAATDPNAACCLMVLLSPQILYEGPVTTLDKNANVSRVAIGIVYKPDYVEAVSFDKALRIIMNYRQARKGSSEASGKLVNDDLLFLHVSSESTFFPLAKPYPTLMDYARKNMIKDGGLHGEDFRAFRLYLINYLAPEATKAVAKVFIPRLNGADPKVTDVEASKRPQEAMSNVPTADSGHYVRSTVRVAAESELHWNIEGDLPYAKFLATLQKLDDAVIQVQQRAASLEKDKGLTESILVNLAGEEEGTGEQGGDQDIQVVAQDQGTEVLVDSQPTSSAGGIRFQLGSHLSQEEAAAAAGQRREMASILKKTKGDSRLIADEILASMSNHHVQTLAELAHVRMIERSVAEGLLAESARVHLIAGEDTMRSLKTFQATVKTSIDRLRDSLDDLLDRTSDPVLRSNVMALMDQHGRETSAAAIFPLVLLDAARNDMQAFLQSRLDNLSAATEARVAADACVERFSNHMNALWGFLEDPRLNNPEVAFRVQVGLSSTRPLVANYFHGALEGVLGLLGLHTPVPERSRLKTIEAASKYHARLLKQYLAQATGGYETDWEERDGSEQEDLHLDYLKDFSVRKADKVHCVFESSMMEDLLGPLQDLKIQDHYVRKAPREFKTKEELWTAFRQTSHSEQDYVSDLLVNSAARATNYLFGGPEGDSQREDDKGRKSENPAGLPLQPGKSSTSRTKDTPRPASRPADGNKPPSVKEDNSKEPPKVPSNKGPGPVKRTQSSTSQGGPLAKKVKMCLPASEIVVHLQGAIIQAGASKSMTGVFAPGTSGERA